MQMEENIIKMEIGELSGPAEDSILKNLSETRGLWKSYQSNNNTKMLQPKTKQYENIKIDDIGSSSETESESEPETSVPSVRNMKSKWESDSKASPVKIEVQPITVPIVRQKQEIFMRNRFHKEPVNKDNIIRPDQAGTKENPDYVVNIHAVKSQFASGTAPIATRPITEPLPNKQQIQITSISRVQSAPVNLADVVKSSAGEREEPVKPNGGLAAVKAQWESQMTETSRGRSRSRRPDQINLKEEAREVRIREKSVARESRRARRAVSAGRSLTGNTSMQVYEHRRSRSKSPPRSERKSEPAKPAAQKTESSTTKSYSAKKPPKVVTKTPTQNARFLPLNDAPTPPPRQGSATPVKTPPSPFPTKLKSPSVTPAKNSPASSNASPASPKMPARNTAGEKPTVLDFNMDAPVVSSEVEDEFNWMAKPNAPLSPQTSESNGFDILDKVELKPKSTPSPKLVSPEAFQEKHTEVSDSEINEHEESQESLINAFDLLAHDGTLSSITSHTVTNDDSDSFDLLGGFSESNQNQAFVNSANVD